MKNFWLERIKSRSIPEFPVWGKEDLQRRPTKLDRVGIRRMMIYVQKQANKFWAENQETFMEKMAAVMEDIRLREGCTFYSIGCQFKNCFMVSWQPTDWVDWVSIDNKEST